MSMNSQLTEQLGMVKVAGTLKQSTQVQLVQTLLNATRCHMRVLQVSTLRVKLSPGPAQNKSYTTDPGVTQVSSMCLLVLLVTDPMA